MHFARRAPRASPHHSKPTRAPGSLQPPPPSAARLAAEALFSGRPQEPSDPTPVTVVVLKKRGSLLRDAGSADAEPATESQGVRAPRIFTLVAPAPAAAPVIAEPAVTEAPSPRRRARSDRIGHDTRARVIRHVTVNLHGPADAHLAGGLPTTLQAQPATADDTGHEGSESVAHLQRRLEQLDRVFAEIRHARAFTLVDAEAQLAWLRLSQRAALIARELQAL